MSIPIWMLLGFATWTLLLLMAFVGVYRWVNILLWKAPIASFRSDQLEGAESWYKRGTRAHANCVENLPCSEPSCSPFRWPAQRHRGRFTMHSGPDRPHLSVVGSRVHCQTDAFVAVRLNSVQLLCFLTLIVMIVRHALLAA